MKNQSPVSYLPEYLFNEPIRVLRSWWQVRSNPRYKSARRIWRKHLLRDFSPNRVRRWGQALVLAAEFSTEINHIYAHFLHTPASVAHYASMLTGHTWSVSSHAKDIWLTPNWEKREKLESCSWAVTCTNMDIGTLTILCQVKHTLAITGWIPNSFRKKYSNILPHSDQVHF